MDVRVFGAGIEMHSWQAVERRVVPSPEPAELLDIPVIALLLLNGSIVVGANGGGMPVTRDDAGMLHGAEAVVDKDLTTALLARSVDADVLLLTDMDAVQDGHGTPHARPIHHATIDELRSRGFPTAPWDRRPHESIKFAT